MRKFLKLIKLCFLFFIGTSTLCLAQSKSTPPPAPYIPGELIVKFKAGNSAAKTSHLSTKMQARVVKQIPELATELWKVDEQNAGVDVLELVEQYKDHPDIEFIEPNYLYTTSEIDLPNDTEFSEQWALYNIGELEGSIADADIDAPEAWAIQSESPSIVVGIIDTGVDWQHPDLVDNIWQNLAEDIDGDSVVIEYDTLLGRWVFDPDDINGEDDDGNGYADDFIGWNFVEDNNQPFDYYAVKVDKFVQSHGTHVAGIIGASGNNEAGISGVTQKVQLAPLKFLTDERTPQGSAWDATRAIRYAYNMGMQISNNSWGGSATAGSVGIAIEEAGRNNHLFVTTAGNGDQLYKGFNIDNHNYFPANYSLDNIIVVANSTNNDALSNSSNYGLYNVDIAAPGTDIFSCLPNNSIFYQPYGLKSGTSMAAPLVSGTLALLWQHNFELYKEVDNGYIKQLLIENVDTIPQLQLKVGNSGRLNAHKALVASIDTAYANQYRNCRQQDALTLVSIYHALELKALNFWDYENTSMDTWEGIQLDRFGCVSTVDVKIKDNKAYPIPPEIGNLAQLKVLKISQYNLNNNVSDNELVELPIELFSLNKLETLNLDGYKLNGPISAELGNLTNLKYLSLNGNNLSGPIPVELSNLYKLKGLSLSNNKLVGSIPEEIENLTYLGGLNLSYNQLTYIPGSIGKLNLEHLNLSFNNFEGELPSEIGRLTNLHELYLNDNNFSGSIPGSFSNLKRLGELEFLITNNNLSGCYDPELIKIGGYSPGIDFRINGFFNNNISDGNNFEVSWEEFVETGANSCWASEATKVWPGDLNNDGIVDGKDIVFYGLAKGMTGPTRKKPEIDSTDNVIDNIGNTNWEGQLCPDWDSNVYGINAKHSDANGDGLVDTLDYVALMNNMDSINPDHYSGSNNSNYYSNGIQLVLEPVEINGKRMTYDLFLNNLNEDQSTIYGLSGTIEFNSGISSDSSIELTDNCIDKLHSYTNLDADKNRIVFALTQVDDVNITCEDALARILIVVEDAVEHGGDQFVSFKVNGIHTQKNTIGGAVNESIGATAYSSFSSNAEETLAAQAVVSPKLCFIGGTAKAEVYGGKEPYTYEWSTGETGDAIYNLTAGEYNLVVTDANGATKEIVFEVEDYTEPEYDENGELIECVVIVETECPDDINYIDSTSENEDLNIMHHGVYKAANSIATDAKIYKREEVELKAGDIISLEAGFNMDDNTQLDITIENCNEE